MAIQPEINPSSQSAIDNRIWYLDDQIWHQNIGNVKFDAELYDRFGDSLAAGDFNGDGSDDLSIGVPGESLGSTLTQAGAVNVLYGSFFFGLTDAGNQIWHQNRSGVLERAEDYDRFGDSLATGDFNGDGKDDLAVGVPYNDRGAQNAGAVNVLYGSNNGLTATGNQILHQNSPLVLGVADYLDSFGSSLATGDFDGDGRDDLAVGVPNEEVSSVSSAGAVNVLYGSNSGLTAADNQLWHQNSLFVEGGAEYSDRFGSSLTTGDFNGDGKDDLAVGVPYENLGSISDAGAVNVLYGASNGLTAAGDRIWHQNSSGVKGVGQAGDRFGKSLAAGDFNGDGKDDLAVGVPYEDIGSITDAGAVNVLYGSLDGLTAEGDQMWHQNTPEVRGVAEASDYFGASLGVGDFNGDGYDDLAIGVHYEDIGSISNAGAVNVLYGSWDGLTAESDQMWHQDRPGVEFDAEIYDRFGASLSVGDFNNDGYDDLAVGVPGESIGSISGAGATHILFGSVDGLFARV